MRIKPIKLSLPSKDGVELIINVLPFNIEDTTCGVSYEVKSEEGESLASGNYVLTEEQYNLWGSDNTYLEDIVLEHLELERETDA